MWEIIDGPMNTFGSETPGLGVIVAAPGVGMCFVPGARLSMLKEPINGATHMVIRDERTSPPLVNGRKASDIKVRPDPGAQQFYTMDDPEY